MTTPPREHNDAALQAQTSAMIGEDQSQVIAFLGNDMGGLGPTEKTIATHISRVFLKRDRAFKLKQAVHFPYVDYSTAALRLAACRAELELNRRTAPNLYLGVRQITRDEKRNLLLDGDGSLVDAVVEMRRFAEEDLFDKMALGDALTPALMSLLAGRIAAFHDAAVVNTIFGGVVGMAEVLDINDQSLRATKLVSRAEADAFSDAFLQELKSQGALLEARRKAGKVRRCHGDLILRNICMFEGVPMLFDCIEFSEPLATIDVLYDLAFLLMDLWHREQAYLANFVFNRYLDICDEADGLPLMPFFMAVRAAVRAHVNAAQAMEMHGEAADALIREARSYFNLAKSFLQPRQATLVAFGGFSGSGKSTMAAKVAPILGAPPGARVLNSDRIRKRMQGVTAAERLPEAAYRAEVSQKVYSRLFDEARQALHSGISVVADAVFDTSEHRAAIAESARSVGAQSHGFWLEAPKDTLLSRIEARVGDPSDATAEVLEAQLLRKTAVPEWTRIDALGDQADVAAQILATLGITEISKAGSP